MSKTIGILTGGGDCPGLNPAIAGAVMRAADHGYKVVGLQQGWKGLVEGISRPLTVTDVEDIVKLGGTIIKTSRTNPYKKEGAVEKCLTNFKKMGLDALIAIGGEDTLGVATRLYEDHKINVVGVPKTMDNDLGATDRTFGFDTATSISMDAAERLKDTGKSHSRIMVLEVMGRHAGWVAVFTGIASGADWVLVPERTPDVDKMVAHLKKVHARRGVALVVVSEGVTLEKDKSLDEELDDFGHMILRNRNVGESVAKIIEDKSGIETRWSAIGHVQRGGFPNLYDRILGLRVGTAAADFIKDGKFGVMAALKGDAIEAVSLKEATSNLKTVSKSWLEFSEIFFK